jgi:aminoglycoside 3-N-acetyltransferase I
LTAYELAGYYSETSEIFIYDIAVNPAFQQKGLGKQLLLSLKEYATQKNISAIFVDANEEDEHALDFYHATGGKAEKVIQFTYFP